MPELPARFEMSKNGEKGFVVLNEIRLPEVVNMEEAFLVVHILFHYRLISEYFLPELRRQIRKSPLPTQPLAQGYAEVALALATIEFLHDAGLVFPNRSRHIH